MKLRGGRLHVIDLERDNVCIATMSDGRSPACESVVSGERPKGVDPADAAAVGAWIGGLLKGAGVAGGRALFAVPRGNVVLKRLSLPKPESDDELVGMVRIQLARQLTFDAASAAIDFVPASPDDPDAQSVAIIAAALPAERVEYYRHVCDGASLKLEGVTLRAAGAAPRTLGGTQLIVTIAADSAEFVIVGDGGFSFARAADVTLPKGEVSDEKWGRYTRRVAIEAKRTWMTLRTGLDLPDFDSVGVLGDAPFARELEQRCAEELELSVRTPESPECPPDTKPALRVRSAPLIGIADARAAGAPLFDFAHPRTPPDRAAARRQLVLLSVFGAIVLGGAGWVFAGMQVDKARASVETLEAQRDELREQYQAFLREHARASHLVEWTEAGFDWPAHLDELAQIAPGPDEALFDRVTGSMASEVRFKPAPRSRAPKAARAYSPSSQNHYQGGAWSLTQIGEIEIDGRVVGRDVVTAFRERLLASGLYDVENKGPEVADRFSFELRTSEPLVETAGSTTTKEDTE